MADRPVLGILARAGGLGALALVASLATAACAVGPGPARSVAQLDKLLAEKRFFELRRLLESPGNLTQPELLYVRGRVANAFNQVGESITALTGYLRIGGAGEPRERRREALGALAEDYVKSFQYAKAAEIRAKMLPFLKEVLPPGDFADFKATTRLWQALASTPPQSLTIPEDTELPPAGNEGVPVTIGSTVVPLLPDTGSSLSLITRTEAERSGIRLLDISLDILTSTGERARAQGGVAGELRLGRIVARNVVFLVVPPRYLYFPEIKAQRAGLLGFPVLNALKEITLFKGGGVRVPVEPGLGGPPDFFLKAGNPVLETNLLGRRLLLQLDTGASSTQFYPSFYRDFHDRVVARGSLVGETIEGVGTGVTVPAYVIRGVDFELAGREVRLDWSVPVLTRPTSTTSEEFDGVLGLDILTHFRSLTINYQAMRIAID